jgi:leucyl-tRNA synthetase
VQVNCKLRSIIDVPYDISNDKLKELVMADPKVKTWIADKAIKDFIVIPRKLVNLVT